MVYREILKYYSVVERNGLLMHATTGVDLRGIVPNGKKRIPKGSILFDSVYRTLSKWQNYRDGNRLVIARSYASITPMDGRMGEWMVNVSIKG